MQGVVEREAGFVAAVADETPTPIPAQCAGSESLRSDPHEEYAFPSTDSLRDQLQAIRRRLWILNATLDSLPAKIELACRASAAARSGGVSPGLRVIPSQASCNPANRHSKRGGDRRRKVRELARLRARAERAEHSAKRAINDAATTFGEALELVMEAFVARAKADEFHFNNSRGVTPSS